MIHDVKKFFKADYVRLALKDKFPFLRRPIEKAGGFSFTYAYYPYFYGLFYEIFVEEIYRIDLPSPARTIIDAGANTGMSAAYFAQKFPEADIMCFEPNPEAIEYLSKNIERNKIHARVMPYALGGQDGTTTFYVDADIKGSSNAGSVKLIDAKNRPTKEIAVETRKLSSFIENDVDILKLDIEGGEMAVMNDLVATGKIKHIKNILAEFHYDPQSLPQSLAQFLQILESNGFGYYLTKRQKIFEPKMVTHSYAISAFRK